MFHKDAEPELQPFDDGVSPAQKWFVEKQLEEGEAEKYTRGNAFPRTIEASVIARMTVNNGFRLYVTGDMPCVQNISRRLAICTTHFGLRLVLSELRLYRGRATADAKWFILERSEALCNGSLRVLFYMTVMDKFFRFIYTADMIHSIMVQLRQCNVPEGGFSCQIQPDGRAMIQVILIHVINMPGKPPGNIDTYHGHIVFGKARLALRNNCSVRNNSYETGNATCIEYGTRDNY